MQGTRPSDSSLELSINEGSTEDGVISVLCFDGGRGSMLAQEGCVAVLPAPSPAIA